MIGNCANVDLLKALSGGLWLPDRWNPKSQIQATEDSSTPGPREGYRSIRAEWRVLSPLTSGCGPLR